MESEDPVPLVYLADFHLYFQPPTAGIIFCLIILLLLLICSALISGSEVAFFSLSPSDIAGFKKNKSNASKKIVSLLKKPEQLLGTILVVNNFVNVGIVILSAYITNSLVDFRESRAIGFLIQIVLITLLLLLFGEILPKIYANQFTLKFSLFMAFAITILEKIFKPLVILLVSSTSLIRIKLTKKKINISMDELSDALDLSSTEISEDEQILKGIVKFGNIAVSEIMKSRIDVFAIELSTPFPKLLKNILESGYSRIPIYADSFDHLKGILYIKDLLPHLHNKAIFKWQSLIRPPYFVPESKKINDLLGEFQSNKIHMAVVIDEYGGTSGIVTLEDIIEEIVGEIKDEYDEDDIFYTKLNDTTYIFEGKTLLNDFYKVLDKPDTIFNEIKGDADTLAGLILEIKGDIPEKDDEFTYNEFVFRIESVDNRRIKKIRVSINPTD